MISRSFEEICLIELLVESPWILHLSETIDTLIQRHLSKNSRVVRFGLFVTTND